MTPVPRLANQGQVPGTEHKAPKALRTLHDQFAQVKYDVKAGQKLMKELGDKLKEDMPKAEVTGLSTEIDWDGERRTVTTKLTTKAKLTSKMDNKD